MFSIWSPAADILSSPTYWLIKVELAGVDPDEVEITSHGNSLRVKGCRKDSARSRDFCYHVLEIRYSQFEREITLPFVINPNNVSWQYQHGMLLIRVVRD